MNRTIALAVLSLALPTSTLAADLVVDVPAVVASDPDYNMYVQIFGGGVANFDSEFFLNDVLDSTYDMDMGYALGGAIGLEVMDGVAVELDVLHTSRTFTEYSEDTLDTTSLMANVKGTMPINDMFSVYAGAGLGVIHTVNAQESGDSYGYTGAGYQLMAGATASLTDSIAALAEVRYQNSFGPLPADTSDYGVQSPVVAVMAGLKFNF